VLRGAESQARRGIGEVFSRFAATGVIAFLIVCRARTEMRYGLVGIPHYQFKN
jgi:hypothetical protein